MPTIPDTLAATRAAGWSISILLLAGGVTSACSARPSGSFAEFTDAVLVERFEDLHRPVYEVYGMGLERDGVHRHLAASFAGEALTREYIEHFTTLVRMAREHTAIDVLRVDYENVTLLERQAKTARIEADWNVSGLVTHQGHRHPRINRYRAVYTLGLDAGALAHQPESAAAGLRIVDTRVRSAERRRSALPSGAQDGMPTSEAGTLSVEELLRSGLAQELLEAADGVARGRSASEEGEPEATRDDAP